MKQFSYKEWRSWRNAGITGSEAPILMKASPWATPNDLFMRRTGRAPEQPKNFAMQRGIKLEPEARSRYEEMVGVSVPALCLESEDWTVARASFDGINEDARLAIEIKCPGKDDHTLALRGQIPGKYIYQLVHQIYVCGFSSIDYVSYHPSFEPHHQIARVVFFKDLNLQGKLLAEERRFWKCLKSDTPPDRVREESRPTSKFEFPVRKSRGFLPPR